MSPANKKINILLIEDDEDDFIITRDLLEDIEGGDYELHWAPDLGLARKALALNEHDICLMDYSLGAVDGVTLLKEAKTLGFTAPVIMLTGQDDTRLDTEASQAGAVDYLVKSQLSASRLARAVRYAVARKQIEAERVERMRAESANQAKSKFLTHLSHELRTPLTAILGYADLLLHETQTPSSVEKLGIIKRNGNHLLSLLNDVLDLSKIEAGKLDVDKTETYLTPLLTNLIELLQVKANDKDLTLAFVATGKIPEQITTDPLRLQQILLNLLSNAIKFTNQGSVTLRIDPSPEEEIIRFTVIDTGIGIEKRQINKLFQPFSQLHPSQVGQESGSGLGLAISAQLTQKLNGDLSVESALGEGSRFTVSLPMQAKNTHWVDLKLKHNTSYEAPTPAPQLQGRVLVADDIPEIRALVSQIIRMTGVHVDSAEDGQAAWDMIQQHGHDNPYDLIFLDVQMPRLTGPELAQKLRAADYPNPVVALTAQTMDDQKQQCYDVGFNAHLGKPIDRDLVWQLLKHYLKAKSNTKRVLIVEDDRDALEVTSQILELLGAEVDCASSAQEALNKVNDSLDGILLDINLPDMRGDELAPKLRSKLHDSAKILAVSGEQLSKADLFSCGFNDSFIKPLDMQKIQALMDAL
ncbi:response regulator [Halioxenophilus aromaticivorans]|uniref:histidine kinase n=1 Tax=Halioxenophilus aromaticivorans TaxID=1306992 RepID=A0AAV3U4G6_9ALTE